MSDDVKSDQNVQRVIPFLRSTDMERSLPFYVDGLGFTVTKRWEQKGKVRWCWLEKGDAAMMLQEIEPAEDPGIVQEESGLPILVFMCKNALALYKEIRSRGLNASVPQVNNGFWVIRVIDPDGHRMFFESEPEPVDISALEEIDSDRS
jgi:lactoylglutathione lyase